VDRNDGLSCAALPFNEQDWGVAVEKPASPIMQDGAPGRF
jgi:hypothetical protein